MRGERVLITGGAGAIGSHLADLAVRAERREVIVVDNFVRGRRENLAWAARQRTGPGGRRRHPRRDARRSS